MRRAAQTANIATMRTRPLLATLGLLLATPASALAASAEEVSGTDHTTELMFGLIIVLMVALVVIGIVEQRRSH
jgi:hypothetical protein